MIRIHVIRALVFRQEIDQFFVRVGKQKGRAAGLVRPVELFRAHGEDAAQDEAADAGWMGLRVGQGERGAPGAAEDEVPFGDVEVAAQELDVGDEVPGCVVFY
jgi:hypothetical protein